MKYFLLIALWVWPAVAQPVSETGLPLPRYVSLKGDEANMRSGPGKRYPIKWTYARKALPIKIVNEYEHWRQVEDHEGVKGWMHKSVLSGRRTAIITQNDTFMRDKPTEQADISARLMQGVIVGIESCRRDWCEVEIKNKEGWVPITQLWGAKL